ncbi:sugar transferase [Nakamurella sp.]|uniref:sugar transferase n=1 Tax=Nakamurella sp. TaxID=1869182 RepID=UPI003B3B16EA
MALIDPMATRRGGRRPLRHPHRDHAPSVTPLVDDAIAAADLDAVGATVGADRVADGGVTAASTPASASSTRSAAAGPIWARRYARGLVVTDLLCLVWAGLGVHLFEPSRPPSVTVTVLLVIGAWLLALELSGTRESSVLGYGASEYKRIIHASLIVFGLVAIGAYLFRLDLPRSVVAIMLPAGLFGLLATRYIWRRWLSRQRRAGAMMSKVVAVGDRQTVGELLVDLARAPYAGYQVIGVCVHGEGGKAGEDRVGGVPVLGAPEEVATVAATVGADAVAVTASAAFGPSAVRRLSWDLEGTDTELILAPALTNIAGPRVHTQPVAGLPLIHVDRPTYRGANRLVKRMFDLVGSLTLVVLFSPVLAAVAAAITLTSRGPVFFRQDRVGINGETFRMIKFRSMVVDAEKRLEALKQEQTADAGNQVLFKMKNDPRITGVGRFIRRFSIDELPQLFNVVRGDMSLGGPRPPLRAVVDLYGDDALRRLLVKPGMTGLWQVSGRSDLTWDDSVRLDVYYVENWSITGDLVILWRTAKAVLGSSGAY